MLEATIVMTVYNGVDFLYEQLDSIKNQTFQIKEVLIFDDCSTDNSVKIISDYILRFNLTKWRIIVNKKQKGWRINFFEGFMLAKGDIIFPCDQDDVWHLDKIMNMMDKFEIFPEINVLTSNYIPFFQDNAEEFVRNYKNDKTVEKVNLSNKNMYNQRPGCSMGFRRKFLENYSKIWNAEIAHDEFLWKTALLTNSLAIYNENTMNYRRHSKNVTRRMHSLSNRILENRACKFFFEKAIIYSICDNQTIVEKQYKFFKTREIFFYRRTIKNFAKLIPFINLYKTKKNFLGDFCVLVKPSYFNE